MSMDEWLEDDADDLDEHERLTVREPFATTFRTKETQRYDLLASLAVSIKYPSSRTYGIATKRFLEGLYEAIADAWGRGNAAVTPDRAREFVTDVIYGMDFEEVVWLMNDFGWGSMSIKVTPDTYEGDIESAAVSRLSPKVERLLQATNAANRRPEA